MKEKSLKKDHRLIAQELDLYVISEKVGQGLPIFLPNWVVIRDIVARFIKKKQKEFNFQEVITPILGSEELYKISGHLDHYNESMFPSINKNNETLYLRPMTCPHHCLIYQRKPRSYRELPFRLCENSLLFRYESSGSLKGSERSRYMELSDHHIFVNFEKLKEEIKLNYFYIESVLKSLSFEIDRLVLSLHDSQDKEKYHSNKNLWKKSEDLLAEILTEIEIPYIAKKGEAAFYGPKLDFEVKTSDEKYITISTIQLDFLLPQKFNLNYINQEGKLNSPIIIHQSPIGSYQRFIALLLEKTNGKLPFLLSPLQIAILPINESEEINNYCKKLTNSLNSLDIRVKTMNNKTLSHRIREIKLTKIPYYLVIGNKEMEEGVLNLSYSYQESNEKLTEKELIEKFNQQITKLK